MLTRSRGLTRPRAPCFARSQVGYHVGMLDTDAVLLRDPRSFFFRGSLANITDVLVSSDCVSPSADGQLVRRARACSVANSRSRPLKRELSDAHCRWGHTHLLAFTQGCERQ